MNTLFDRVIGAMAWIAGALLLFQVISVSCDVLIRYFFGTSIRWVITLNEWSLLFIAFLAAAWLQRQGGHVRLDILSATPDHATSPGPLRHYTGDA